MNLLCELSAIHKVTDGLSWVCQGSVRADGEVDGGVLTLERRARGTAQGALPRPVHGRPRHSRQQRHRGDHLQVGSFAFFYFKILYYYTF